MEGWSLTAPFSAYGGVVFDDPLEDKNSAPRWGQPGADVSIRDIWVDKGLFDDFEGRGEGGYAVGADDVDHEAVVAFAGGSEGFFISGGCEI